MCIDTNFKFQHSRSRDKWITELEASLSYKMRLCLGGGEGYNVKNVIVPIFSHISNYEFSNLTFDLNKPCLC